MGSLTFSVHPLFYLFGFYYALTGRIFMFIVCTVSAVIHELGHSIVSANCGYRLNKIKLMPFGAVVMGCFEDVRLKDEILIALAGPFINLAIALFFIAVWWIFPTLYAFTDIVVEANLSLFLVNVLPAYPLDGGRVIKAMLKTRLKEERAELICKCLGIFLTAIILALFIISLFNSPNFSILFFASFILFGVFSKNNDSKYLKIYSGISSKKLSLGVPVKTNAVSKNITIKRLIAVLDVNCINQIQVFDNGEVIKLLSQAEINAIIESACLYDSLEGYL